MKPSITDTWNKQVKEVQYEGRKFTLILLTDPADVNSAGLIVKEEGVDYDIDERWTIPACQQLYDAGEMKLFDPDIENLKTTELHKWFYEGLLPG